MSGAPSSEVTRILERLRESGAVESHAEDFERLLAITYDELRALASALMRGERPGHTLQPTALVHEAYLKLVGAELPAMKDRTHFFAIAARAMRQVLVDHARRAVAAKRGGGWNRITLDDALGASGSTEIEVLDLDMALSRLAQLDERASRTAEMRIFAGMTVKETAAALGVSPRTVDGDWSMARAWLSREMRGGTAT